MVPETNMCQLVVIAHQTSCTWPFKDGGQGFIVQEQLVKEAQRVEGDF